MDEMSSSGYVVKCFFLKKKSLNDKTAGNKRCYCSLIRKKGYHIALSLYRKFLVGAYPFSSNQPIIFL